MGHALLADSTPLWRVASPYFSEATVRWLDEFVPDDRHRFELVNRVGEAVPWHLKKSPRSSVAEWREFLDQARITMEQTCSGMIGVFPQVTATLAARSRLRRDDRPIVSWFFNTSFDSAFRRGTGRASLGRVNRFVVHTTIEIEAYAKALKLPEDRFRFVHLQYGDTIETEAPDVDEPYVFATGSGFRDYGTFFDAVSRLGYKTLVLAGPRVLQGLDIPPNVEIIESMSRSDIRRHVRHAAVNVVPMTTDGLTAGVVTLVETFRHGRGVVATRRSGLEDYLIHDKNSLLSSPRNAVEMAECIEAYWTDEVLRTRIDNGARTFADENCTDTAAAGSLVKVLDEVLGIAVPATGRHLRAA
jgi:glycosyltransferase involved in cell wall biosynthesis